VRYSLLIAVFMKKKKNIYINEGLWESAKWVAKYKGVKNETKSELNDYICKLIKKWVDEEMVCIKHEDPDMFHAISTMASEKENAAKKLEDTFNKTKLKETMELKKVLRKQSNINKEE
jgi:hypothetical protein